MCVTQKHKYSAIFFLSQFLPDDSMSVGLRNRFISVKDNVKLLLGIIKLCSEFKKTFMPDTKLFYNYSICQSGPIDTIVIKGQDWRYKEIFNKVFVHLSFFFFLD